MKTLHLALIPAALLLPATLSAQTAPAATAPAATATPTVGATVYDTAGGEVGTIDSLPAGAVVINTGTNKVAVPTASIGTGAKGPVMAMTKVQLDAAYQQQQAQAQAALKAKLVPGTSVGSLDGTAPVGTIKAADPQYVTLTTAKGDVKLPANGFSTNASGGVIIGMTAAQFAAAIGSATPAAGQNVPSANK